MNKSIKISGLVWALLLASGQLGAAGLGKLTVQSTLGQPLRAEIELLSVSKDELSDISAKVASSDAFRQARMDRSEALGNLRFAVDQRSNGQPVIRITSSSTLSDPYLDLLIELHWSSGRLIREYTILLDPPAETKVAEATMSPVLAEAGRNGEAKSAATPTPVPAEPAPPKAATTPAPAPSRYGPVKSGETLRGIAGKVKHSDVTLEQMMVSLFQANKSAFFDGNMNRMKKGQVLNVPEAKSVVVTPPREAARTVQGHFEQWNAYRNKVAGMAETLPPAEEKTAAGKITPKADDKAAPAPAPAKDVLKLSKGEPGTGGKPDAKTQERMRGLEEEVAAKGRALQEAQDRVGQLERTVRDMQKLLEMKAQEAAKAPPPAPVPAPAPAPAEPPVLEVPAPEPAPAPPPPVVAPKPAPSVAPLPAAEPSSSWISTFFGNPLYIAGVVVAILLSALLWMMMVGSRRRQGLNKFEDSIMTGGEFKNGSVFTAPAGGTSPSPGATTEGSMLLTDFSRLGMGAIDSHEVDPIAEAEVYMAYGRDAQAEEILKEALGKDPSRHEIALKLLEIYASRKDTMAFETTASELYAGLGGQNTPVWQRAAEMGRSIDPENPLYRVAPTVSAGGQAMAAAAPIAAAAAVAVAKPEPVQPAAPAAEDNSLDFPSSADLGASLSAPPLAPAPQEFNLDDTLIFQSNPAFAAPAPDLTPPAPEPALVSQGAEELDMTMPDTGLGTLESFADEASLEMPAAEVPELAMEAEESIPEALLAADAGLDFDMSEALPEPEAEAVPELDLSGIDLELETSQPVAELEMPSPDADLGVDLEADLDFAPTAVPEAAPAAELELPMESESAAASAESIDPELREEVNTKLDLAKAYLEMGDREGAREILQEVINEGDAGQKADANRLLSEAG